MQTFKNDTITSEIINLINSERVFSDILIQQDEPVMIKTPTGWAEYPDCFPPSVDDLHAFMGLIDENWTETLKVRAINCPIEITNWRLRINAYLASGGEKICLSIRKIEKAPVPLERLGLPASVNVLLEAPRGIILIGGPTGSGKTTTIAAMADRINATRSAHIVCIEDPIEYVQMRKKSIFSQREVGLDVPSYYEGLRDAMRQRPDVIIIGEIRDRDTADTALLAAESGHLVIASLHASSGSGTVQKLLGFFTNAERDSKIAILQHAFVGAIYQYLLPSIDGSHVVLASEILCNHEQKFSEVIGDKAALRQLVESQSDGLSRSLTQCLFDLVIKRKITDVEALTAVFGQNQQALYEKIKAYRS